MTHPWRRSSLLAALFVIVLAFAGCGNTGSSASGNETPAEGTWTPAVNSSPGCGQTAHPLAPGFGNSGLAISVEGKDRRYRVYIPHNYRSDTPMPVVYTFHGLGSNAEEQLLLSGVVEHAEQNDYIVVAPEATFGIWNLPQEAQEVATADVHYVNEVIDEVNSRLCVDKSRAYASGMSLGSAMTLLLACQEQQRFAAFAGVAAAFYDGRCDNSSPAPIIYFHGTEDNVVPYDGGAARGIALSPVPEAINGWVQHNKCTDVNTSEVADATLETHTGCAQNAVVASYRINGGGHTWPGAPIEVASAIESQLGLTSSIPATDLMWQFFQNYQLDPATTPAPTDSATSAA